MSKKVLKISIVVDLVVLLIGQIASIYFSRVFYGISPEEAEQKQEMIALSGRVDSIMICLLFVLSFFLLQYNKEKKAKGLPDSNKVLIPVLLVGELLTFFPNPYYSGKITALIEFFVFLAGCNVLMLVVMLGDKIGEKGEKNG